MLTIIDARTLNPLRVVPLTQRQRLAGPAAWTPDDSQILLAAGDVCAWAQYCADQTWHLQRLDLATGTISDGTVRGRPGSPTVVAWRGGEPVVQQAGEDASCNAVALTGTGARALPLSVAGNGCADYARDLLQDGSLGGPGIAPSPWQAQWWAYASVAALLTGLALIVRRIRRRRRPTPTGPGSTRMAARRGRARALPRP